MLCGRLFGKSPPHPAKNFRKIGIAKACRQKDGKHVLVSAIFLILFKLEGSRNKRYLFFSYGEKSAFSCGFSFCVLIDPHYRLAFNYACDKGGMACHYGKLTLNAAHVKLFALS